MGKARAERQSSDPGRPSGRRAADVWPALVDVRTSNELGQVAEQLANSFEESITRYGARLRESDRLVVAAKLL